MEEEVEEFDEFQDWRLLGERNLNSLPKRGEKDFEPDGTGVQDSTLQESRNAMYSALEGVRKHNGKNHIKATWVEENGMARVDVARGPHFNTIGKADSSGTLWLMPEEMLYLLERGSMEVWYPNGPPMSLQAAYASCIKSPRDLELLQVYSYLKKIGFTLFRAKENYLSNDNEIGTYRSLGLYALGLYNLGLNWASRWLKEYGNQDILAGRSIYRDHSTVYRDLDVIPSHRPPHSRTGNSISNTSSPESSLCGPTTSPFKVVFDAWKPVAHFRKSDPGVPDYRIVVVSARDSVMPTLAQTAEMFEKELVNEKMDGKSQTMRLKDGWRNLVLAVVDSGIISLYKLGDVGFGEEVIYGNFGNQRKGGGPNRGRKQNSRS